VLYSIFFVRSGWGHLTKRDAMVTVPAAVYFHRFWTIDDPA
jgi:hypothetical protein